MARRFFGLYAEENMLRSLFGAIVLACSVPVAAEAAGPKVPINVGSWSGGSYFDDKTGAFSHCSTGTRYNSGVYFLIFVGKTFTWSLGFANPAWNLTPEQKVPLLFIFDGKRKFNLIATASRSDMVLIPMPNTSDLINTFRRSYSLSVFAQGNEFKFNLDGTSRVMPALVNCVGSNTGQLQNASNATPNVPPSLPSADKNSTGVSDEKFELESLRLATNFVLRAQLSNAKMLDRSEFPIAMASFGAAWKSDDLLGAVKIIPAENNLKGIDVAAAVIAADAKECRGKFASGRTSELVDSDVLFRGFSNCEDSAGLRVSQYFVVPRRKGGFIMFSLGGVSAVNAAPPITQREERLTDFRKAALTSLTD